MDGRFAGQVGLVMGGASGIGLAIARRLLAEGASLVVADVNEANLTAVAGDKCATIAADVTVEAQVEEIGRAHV